MNFCRADTIIFIKDMSNTTSSMCAFKQSSSNWNNNKVRTYLKFPDFPKIISQLYLQKNNGKSFSYLSKQQSLHLLHQGQDFKTIIILKA